MPRRGYPWAEWMAMDKLVLVQGVHFPCSLATMVQQVRNAATRHETKVNVRAIDSKHTIVVKIHHRPDRRPARAKQAAEDGRPRVVRGGRPRG